MTVHAGCGCDAVEQQRLAPYEEAIEKLLAQAQAVTEIEELALNEALGRILAEDIVSGIDVPPADNSAMDGYAINFQDVNPDGESRLKISQRIAAGEVGEKLEAATAARIFTGAIIPAGADTVIMQEQTRVEGDELVFSAAVNRGQNIRLAGEDIKKQQTVIAAGTYLRAQELGLAASVGKSHVKVKRKVRVGIFFTGDELIEPGHPLPPGKIYDSNRYTLNGLLKGMHCDIIDLGIVGDTLEQTKQAILDATAQTDLVITSGGVSVGEEDHIKNAIEQLGELRMWKLNIKPGKPVALGLVNGSSFIGLPGNPVSVFATFSLLVSPFLKKMQGRKDLLPQAITVTSAFTWSKPDKRREFARARLISSADGQAQVDIYPSQSSGVLMSTSWADGLVVIPENTPVSPGDQVAYIPFSQMLS